MKTRRSSIARRLALVTTAAGAALALTATTATAAPFATQATATALRLTVLGSGGITVDTGTESAQNDGSQPTVTDSQQPLITLLNGQSVLTAGALGEVAVAKNDGTSAACSGVTGEGGLVEIGNPANCVSPGSAPIVINLANVLGVISARIEADAILATCAGLANGTTSGNAELANARLVADLPLGPDVVVNLVTDVAPNTKLLDLVSPSLAALLSPLVNITLNKQVAVNPSQPAPGYFGGISVTAVSIDALSGALADVELANVTCGPSADLAIVPAVPFAGIPVALATLAMVGGGVALVNKRRSRSAA